jgi:hypothetical protein
MAKDTIGFHYMLNRTEDRSQELVQVGLQILQKNKIAGNQVRADTEKLLAGASIDLRICTNLSVSRLQTSNSSEWAKRLVAWWHKCLKHLGLDRGSIPRQLTRLIKMRQRVGYRK